MSPLAGACTAPSPREPIPTAPRKPTPMLRLLRSHSPKASKEPTPLGPEKLLGEPARGVHRGFMLSEASIHWGPLYGSPRVTQRFGPLLDNGRGRGEAATSHFVPLCLGPLLIFCSSRLALGIPENVGVTYHLRPLLGP